MSIRKNTKKRSKNASSQDYDQNVDNTFKAYINLGENVIVEEISTIDVKKLAGENLTYDHVEEMFFKIMDSKYPEKSFPKAEIDHIEVLADGKYYVPVFSEHDKDGIKKCEKSNKFSKFLVLPEAVYFITPEAKLWMELKAAGEIPDDAMFNYEKYHTIVENMIKLMHEEK